MPYRRRHVRREARHLACSLFLALPFLSALALAGVTSCAAWAAPPEHADPKLAPWFGGLKQPGTGTSCCSIADCRAEPYRQTPTGYEVEIDGEWLPIPEDRVLQRTDNPTGKAITCHAGKIIFCFVRPAET